MIATALIVIGCSDMPGGTHHPTNTNYNTNVNTNYNTNTNHNTNTNTGDYNSYTYAWAVVDTNTTEARAVTVDAGGNLYIAGSAGSDTFLSRYDSSGNLSKKVTLSSSPSNNAPNDVIVDSSGNIYVALNRNYGGGMTRGVIVKYDSGMNYQWERQLTNTAICSVQEMAFDDDGYLYIVGSKNSGFWFGKYDPAQAQSGWVVWKEIFSAGLWDFATGIDVKSGIVYVTGYVNGNFNGQTGIGNSDIFLIKYDTSQNHVMTRLYGTPYSDLAKSVVADADGNVYITGDSQGDIGPASNSDTVHNKRDVFLMKINSSGAVLWAIMDGASNEDEEGQSVVINPSGYPMWTGVMDDGTDGLLTLDITTAVYDPASGAELWKDQWGPAFDSMGMPCLDEGYDLTFDAGGNLYVTGSSGEDTNRGAVLIKYAP